MNLLNLRTGLLATLVCGSLLLNGCVVQHRTVVQSPPHHSDYSHYRFSQDDNYRLYDYYHPRHKEKHNKRGYKRTPAGHYQRPYFLHRPLPMHVRYQPLARDIQIRLPSIPSDLIRVRIGSDIVLMHRKTRVIYDILFDF